MFPEWFVSAIDVFAHIPNTPDVVFVDTGHKEVLLQEVSCVFDLYMEQAFQDPSTCNINYCSRLSPALGTRVDTVRYFLDVLEMYISAAGHHAKRKKYL